MTELVSTVMSLGGDTARERERERASRRKSVKRSLNVWPLPGGLARNYSAAFFRYKIRTGDSIASDGGPAVAPVVNGLHAVGVLSSWDQAKDVNSA